MKKQKENSHEGITWSEMGKQNVQAEKAIKLLTVGNLTRNEAHPVGHLTFVSKRLSAVEKQNL